MFPGVLFAPVDLDLGGGRRRFRRAISAPEMQAATQTTPAAYPATTSLK